MFAVEPQPHDSESARASTDLEQHRGRKRRDKIRSAWISFVGRIVAQFVGAAATIALGLLVLSKYQVIDADASKPPSPSPAAERVLPTRVLEDVNEVSVAVLPMLSLSADAAHEFVADSMTETLIAELARGEDLRVISRTSIMNYKRQSKSIPEIAKELQVRFIVEGSVAHANGRTRITAQLIDARKDVHIWVRQYERRAENTLSVQAEVAGAIARELEVVLRKTDRAGLGATGPAELAGNREEAAARNH